MTVQQCSATFGSPVSHCYRPAKFLVTDPGNPNLSYEPYCGTHIRRVVTDAVEAEARARHAGYRNPVLVLPVD